MSDTLSTMIPLGFEAPSFKLLDVKSNVVLNSNKLFGLKATVLMFICNHCPFVVHINKEIVKIANQYNKIGVEFIAICSNDIKNYPQDSPEKMKKVAKKEKYPFPIYTMKIK